MNEIQNGICLLNFKKQSSKGLVYFYTMNDKTNAFVLLKGISTKYGTLKGFHIHECGDLTDVCTSACAHYNPLGDGHGDMYSIDRHYGDLGNLKIDESGHAILNLYDLPIALKDVVGRSIVLHEGEDDLGKGKERYKISKQDISKKLIQYINYSNNEICYRLIGEHLLLAKQLEDKIGNKLNKLRKLITSDSLDKKKDLKNIVDEIQLFINEKIKESKVTGNSGSRIACGIIGVCKSKNIEKLIETFQ